MFLEHSWGLTKPNTVKNNQFFVTLYNAGGEKGEFWLQLFPLDKPGETGCEKKKKKEQGRGQKDWWRSVCEMRKQCHKTGQWRCRKRPENLSQKEQLCCNCWGSKEPRTCPNSLSMDDDQSMRCCMSSIPLTTKGTCASTGKGTATELFPQF